MKRNTIIVILIPCLWSGQAVGADTPVPAPLRASGIDLQYIDKAVRPQDDFFRYVNGKWLASTAIPADRARYGAFDELSERAEARLRAIVDDLSAAKAFPAGSVERKIADLYGSFMDTTAAGKIGLKPLQEDFALIDALADKRDIPALMAHLTTRDVNVPIQPFIRQDDRDSSRYALYLTQAGIGLPDRDYYLRDDDAKLRGIRGLYLKHVAKMLAMAGEQDADRAAEAILRLETGLARVQWTKVENRDPVKTYNKVEIAKLAGLAAGYDWTRYFSAAGFGNGLGYVVVNQPSFITGLDRLLEQTPLSAWKSYFKWHLLAAYARYLDERFVEADFAFSGTILSGIPENRPRWKRGIALVEQSLGEGLGQLYVARYFPPPYKERMHALVANLIRAYRQSIETLDWMSPATKRKALAKLAKFTPKIGYPDKWRDYTGVDVRRDDLVGNVMRARRFEYGRQKAKLGKPIDRGEWYMTPQTVNAYYDPQMNEIVFPAAILQPPFFNPAADDAANYGGIGAVIGHEISHGFDDQGSQYDGDGNLRDWWAREDHEQFRARTRALVAQYGAYSPLPGYHINGELTVGENIADNAGLAIAYKAYRISLGGGAAPLIDGYTGDQRVFMGWTQVWRGKSRDAEAIRLVKTDPHSPAMFRANGTLANQSAFYASFGVEAGDRMFVAPERRVTIW